jgi:response regulator RpfG family c-di-GMP phosphodiesterase
LKVLNEDEVAVILCDYRLPDMTGPDLLARSLEIRPDTIRITLTGQTELQAAQDSINTGRVSHFLLKPWNDDHLRSVVRDCFRRHQMEQEIRRLNELTCRQRDELEVLNHSLEDKVRQRTEELRAAYEETLDALVLALDAREHSTVGHSRRVAMYCLYLAYGLEVEADAMGALYRGALLHDIGKIGIPDAVLLKPGRLDDQERAIIQQHVRIAGELLSRIRYLESAIPVPLHHHERYDGTGYSEGLAGEDISFGARIFSVVDVYDALRSDRPYKKAMPHAQACEIIARESGSQFDPVVVERFLAVPPSRWAILADRSAHLRGLGEILEACREMAEQDEAEGKLLEHAPAGVA